jgi:hypothetical protein
MEPWSQRRSLSCFLRRRSYIVRSHQNPDIARIVQRQMVHQLYRH